MGFDENDKSASPAADGAETTRLCSFCLQLLGEVLLRRSKLGYIPGLPVTDGELLDALNMKSTAPSAKASSELAEQWREMLRFCTDEASGSKLRMPLLSFHYLPSPVWLLAVILAFSVRHDSKAEKAVILLQGDRALRCPDVSMVCALSAYLGENMEKCREELLSESSIKRELFEDAPAQQLVLCEQVYSWLCGLDEPREPIRRVCEVYELLNREPDIRAAEFELLSGYILRHLDSQDDFSGGRLIIELHGAAGSGKRYFSRILAGRAGYGLILIRAGVLLSSFGREWQALLRDVLFLCRINSCIPYLDLSGCDEDSAGVLSLCRRLSEEYLLLFAGLEGEERIFEKLELVTQELSLDKLSPNDSLRFWVLEAERLNVSPEIDFKELTGKYRLSPGGILNALAQAELERTDGGNGQITLNDIEAAIRKLDKFAGAGFVERIDSPFTWNDLKVDEDVLRKLQLACAHLKYRYAVDKILGEKYPYGKGTSVLLYGPPGTGKTMAAQVIANDVQMELYRVDLSQISSKYIGETEKNLEKVFREAERSNVILFFDEADSLFSKRTEVKDSNDKYANQETSYILQRIEFYEGMVILATNLAQNFDSAFMRRITLAVKISFPDESARCQIWESILSNAKLNISENTVSGLAKQFELSGSNIKSAVRNAAFIAMSAGEPMGIKHIIKAVKLEYEKLGKIANAGNFGQFSYLL